MMSRGSGDMVHARDGIWLPQRREPFHICQRVLKPAKLWRQLEQYTDLANAKSCNVKLDSEASNQTDNSVLGVSGLSSMRAVQTLLFYDLLEGQQV